MGFLFGSKTEKTQQPFESNPWKPQQGYLTDAFSKGQGALDKALGNANNIKDATADLTSGQTGVLNKISNFGQGTAGDVSSAAIQAGLQGIGGFGSFNDNAQALFDRSQGMNTGSIIGAAGQYADNPYLQGQIDSALGDVRKAFDGTVAGINSGASGTGNINSTRAGALEARALDDAADRAAAISSGMRGDAYNRGLGLASADIDRQFGQGLASNAQIGNAASQGLNFAGQGLNFGQTGLENALNAESVFQNQAQNEIDGARGLNREEMDLMNQYMGIIGGNYGSQGFQTQVSKSPSIFQQLVGGAASLAGFGFSPFGGK